MAVTCTSMFLDCPLAKVLDFDLTLSCEFMVRAQRTLNKMRRYTYADVLWFYLAHNPLRRHTKDSDPHMGSCASRSQSGRRMSFRTPRILNKHMKKTRRGFSMCNLNLHTGTWDFNHTLRTVLKLFENKKNNPSWMVVMNILMTLIMFMTM